MVRPATPEAYWLPIPASRGESFGGPCQGSQLVALRGNQGPGIASQCQVASNRAPAGVRTGQAPSGTDAEGAALLG